MHFQEMNSEVSDYNDQLGVMQRRPEISPEVMGSSPAAFMLEILHFYLDGYRDFMYLTGPFDSYSL